MLMIPEHIKEIFYNTLLGDVSLKDFEKWLYDNKELEQLMNSDDYLSLISFNYEKRDAAYEFRNLVESQIDIVGEFPNYRGEIETRKLLALLEEAKQKTPNLPIILMDFYELYCDGYYFLQTLALVYGLCVTTYWTEWSERKRKKFLKKAFPKLKKEIDCVIMWIKSKSVTLTGEIDDDGRRGYTDDGLQDYKAIRY